MAEGQTVIWTALPDGRAGDTPTSGLRVSVHVAPQLWNTDPNVKVMPLSEFPDWLDFPAAVAAMTFQVEFDGFLLPATVTSAPPRSDLWKALFDATTQVFPYRFEDDDVSAEKYLVLETGVLAGAIAAAYAHVATDPALGAGADLPGVGPLARTPGILGVARPSEPERPFEPPDRPSDPVPAPELPVPPEERPGCLGWLVRLLCWLARYLPWLQWLLKGRCPPAGEPPIRPDFQVEPFEPTTHSPDAVVPTVSVPGGSPPPPPAPPVPGAGAGTFTPSAAEKSAFEATDLYFRTRPTGFANLPTEAQLAARYDFHQIVSMLGDHPALLRMLGLVVDLTVAHDGAIPTVDTATVRIRPTWTPATTPTVNVAPRTHYVLGDGSFMTRSRAGAAVDIGGGFLHLADDARNPVTQIDVAGSAIKYRNAATNVVVSADTKRRPALQPDEEGLPALQTEGIAVTQKAIVTQYRASALYAKALHNFLLAAESAEEPAKASPPAGAEQADELWADTVLRGYRVDVRDAKAGRWFSLHRRDALYELTKLPGEKLVVPEDEGFVEPSAVRQPDTPAEIRIHETLFSWQGWSLSVPRPHQAIVADDKPKKPPVPVVAHLESKPLYGLDAWYRVVAGSLPRLRYGREYQLRARAVDLAGNSVCRPGTDAFDATPPQATAPITFGRFEPLSPPALMPRASFEEGESVERMVVRSDFDSPPADLADDPDERHVVVPRATQALAELHGSLDTAAAGTALAGDAASKDLASREAGTLTHRLDLATNQRVVLAGAEEVVVKDADGKETGRYWIQKSTEFPLAYLPDPAAQGVQFLSLPGAPLGPGAGPGARPVTRVPFDGAFPDSQSFRLRIVGIPQGQAPKPPAFLPAPDSVLVVEVPQGETHAVRYSCYMSPENAKKMGVGAWVKKFTPAGHLRFRKNVEEGRHWMLMPYRTLVLVHAVRRPLAVPGIQSATATKDKPGQASAVGETSAVLEGTLKVHAASTGKVQLQASWDDPFDDSSKPTFDETTDVIHFAADVGEVQIVSPTDDTPTFKLTHFVKDTKFHRVSYGPVGTTRYREYFDPKAPPETLVRPAAGEVQVTTEVRIPNSARPAPPRIHSVVPTFKWEEEVVSGNPLTVTRIRVGGGLRVYLERPWFSTGWEEQLGVVFAQPGQAPSLPLDERQVVLTHLAADPIYEAVDFPASELTSANDFKDPAVKPHKVTLAENGVRVSVVGFDARFDGARRLWYSDIELAEPTAYFPFIRLALVRFQPTSVEGAHISPVVRAEYAQLLPSRTAVYRFDHGAAGLVRIEAEVSGVGFVPSAGRSRTVWAGVVERRAGPASTELEWETIGTMLPGPSGGDVRFRATFDLTGFQNDQFRVVLREMELFPADEPDPAPYGASAGQEPHGYRVVYADARLVE